VRFSAHRGGAAGNRKRRELPGGQPLEAVSRVQRTSPTPTGTLKSPIDGGQAKPVGETPVRTPDIVETALANAIIAATEARQWQLVAQLAKELEARRRAQDPEAVVHLNKVRNERQRSGRTKR